MEKKLLKLILSHFCFAYSSLKLPPLSQKSGRCEWEVSFMIENRVGGLYLMERVIAIPVGDSYWGSRSHPAACVALEICLPVLLRGNNARDL